MIDNTLKICVYEEFRIVNFEEVFECVSKIIILKKILFAEKITKIVQLFARPPTNIFISFRNKKNHLAFCG